MRLPKIALLGVLTLIFMLSCKPTALNEVIFLEHKLDFELNVENHQASFADSGVMTVFDGANLMYLPLNAIVESLSIDGIDVDYVSLDSTSLSGAGNDFAHKIIELDPHKDALWLIFDQGKTQKVEFNIKYSAVFMTDLEDTQFSNQNVGREITGTIIDKGAYLSPSSFYYPQGNDGLMHFEVSAIIPSNWESVADGNSVGQILTETNKIQIWKNPYASEGLMFMAAPFRIAHEKAGDVDVYCYFFEEDTSLFETYLPATVEYIEMYSELIGPYPYKRFTVAENFFPTGYGMPAWTLLGQKVIRMPFIVVTSLGHEVLHNWWGNSVYVDYENGNWCEGLTVYGADYRYKLNQSEASAKDYRKNILKAYKSYVTSENDFPVRNFVARHNAETRTIGYSKTMMIFHMIEERIGSENFMQAWRDVYEVHKGEKVTWEQWVAAYETTSGQDLSFVIPQWVDRTGALELRVELIATETEGSITTIKCKVSQSDSLYDVKIPVKILGVEGQDQIIELREKATVFEFMIKGKPTAFELDPDYRLFRHLYPAEIEPTVAGALGASEKHFWFAKEQDKSTIKALGENLTKEVVDPVLEKTSDLSGDKISIISLNPSTLPPDLAERITIEKATITLEGAGYPQEGHTFVLSADDKQSGAKLLIVLSEDAESLQRIGQLVPHYGKYSYLVFKGTKNIAKGQWPALTSPLRVEL